MPDPQLETPSFIPEVNSPPTPKADRLYHTLRHTLDSLGPPSSDEDPQINQLRRKAIEDFVRTRTEPVSHLPWLEPRLNPPPLDLPPCHQLPLPPDYQPHLFDSQAATALIPWAPPIEWWHNYPPNLYRPTTATDHLALKILEQYGLDLFPLLSSPENDDYQEAVEENGPPDFQARLYATWATDTAVDGSDYFRNFRHSYPLTEVFHTTGFSRCSAASKAEDSVLFPTPGILTSALEANHHDLENLMDDISRYIDNPHTWIPEYKERTTELFSQLQGVVDSCRWHLDHQNHPDSDTQQFFLQTLENAYLDYNLLLQIGQRSDAKATYLFQTIHDIQALIGGLKIDHASDGRYGDTATLNYRADYLDAFMAVAQFQQTTRQVANCLLNRQKIKWNLHDGARLLFGNPESAFSSPQQLLTLMSILYLKMPRWQQQTYADLINQQFTQMAAHIQSETPETVIFIPTQTTAKVRYPDIDPFDFSQTQEAVRAQYLDSLITFFPHPEDSQLSRLSGRLEVNASFKNWKTNSQADSFLGHGCSGAWIDALNNIHPGFEPKNLYAAPIPEFKATRSLSLLEKFKQVPRLLIESRLGQETVQKIHELLAHNPEAGSLHTVAQFSAMLERLLGRKPQAEEADFISLLQELGMINTQSLKLSELDTQQTLDMLEKIRRGQADLSDLDEGSIIILLLTTSGVIPRELLVELTFKTYETLGHVLTLETAMALEKLDTKRRFTLFGLGKKGPSQIITHRQAVRDFLASKESQKSYNPQTDPDFQTLAKGIIHQVTSLLYHNKRYDATMRSPLIAVLTAKEQGQLVARCAVDGQLLTALLKLISPELQTYFTTTYGPEELMSLANWYAWLTHSQESGGQSHGFNQTNWPNPEGTTSITVADATGNITSEVSPSDISYPEAINNALVYGQATHQQHIFSQRLATGHCLTGGSSLLCNLALDAGKLDYAALADPDDLFLLRLQASSTDLDPDQRHQTLDKLLIIGLHHLAMSSEIDHNRGATAAELEHVVQLSLQTGHLGGAMIAANILKHAAFFTPPIRTHASNLYDLIVRTFAAQPETKFQQLLTQNQAYLTTQDTTAITAARATYLEELARAQAAQAAAAELTERSHRQKTLAQLQPQIDAETDTLRIEAARQHSADLEALYQSQAKHPTLGFQATNQYGGEIASRHQDLITSTQGQLPQSPALDPNLFEAVNLPTQIKALHTSLTGPDGQMLQGDAAHERLQLIQQVLATVAFEMAQRPYQLGSSTNQENLPPPHPQRLEAQAIVLAKQLNQGLTQAAQALGLPIPPLDPKALLATATINPRQILPPKTTS